MSTPSINSLCIICVITITITLIFTLDESSELISVLHLRVHGIIRILFHCLLSSAGGLVATVGGNSKGAVCVFPFVYQGVSHTDCVRGATGRAWCSTTADYDVDGKSGDCVYGETHCMLGGCGRPRHVTRYIRSWSDLYGRSWRGW